VEIVSATAPVNAGDVHLSWDDNELTEWKNDGRLSTGSITYQFARKAAVSEVSMKLSGFRSRTYPVEIMAGDKLVWKGETSLSLGYIYIAFDEVNTQELTVRLTGSGREKDDFSNVVELAGHVELDGFRDPPGMNNAGNLRIIEIEFYEKVK
jgi:hypothetical protein